MPTINGKRLKPNKDYRTVGYVKNTNTNNKAVIRIEGKGSFKGIAKAMRYLEEAAKSKRPKSMALVT